MKLTELLERPDVKDFIEENISADPSNLALKFRGKTNFDLVPVLDYLQLLQKAKVKLPTWYSNRCLLEKRSLEQCSSEITATMKQEFKGENLLDLTCGLGVDSHAFASFFSEVTSIELNTDLAEMVRINAVKLELYNLNVKNVDCIEFIKNSQDRPDLIFIDPDRRLGDERVLDVHKFSPDLFKVLEWAEKMNTKVLVKLSPMFEIEEGYKMFENIECSYIHSVGNEIKEVLYLIHPGKTENSSTERTISIYRKGKISRFNFGEEIDFELPFTETKNFLIEPDVAFYKAHRLKQLFPLFFSEKDSGWTGEGGYFLSDTLPVEFPGSIYRIVETMPYHPEKIKRWLKEKGIKQAWISKKYLQGKAEAYYSALGIKEGGEYRIFLSKMSNKVQVYCCLPI
jgi:hypothetical protein